MSTIIYAIEIDRDDETVSRLMFDGRALVDNFGEPIEVSPKELKTALFRARHGKSQNQIPGGVAPAYPDFALRYCPRCQGKRPFVRERPHFYGAPVPMCDSCGHHSNKGNS